MNINLYKILSKISLSITLVLMLSSLTSAQRQQKVLHKPVLSSVNIVDRNGFTETICNKERLSQFQNIDFLKAQPYQKVLRIWNRDAKGLVKAIVTTYYENGNCKQFLDIVNGRANGVMCEWHENGNMSLWTNVIGGTPDVTSEAERSWLFDGPSYAWNEDGGIIAEMNYSQGMLEGYSCYYHDSGQLWKRIPYCKNLVEGVVEVYKKEGELLQQICYSNGIKHGPSVRYWSEEKIAAQEDFIRGKLETAQYFDQEGNLVSEVKEGSGYRSAFGKDSVVEQQQYINGIVDGEVKVFNSEGKLKRLYHVKNEIKHGEEVEYYVQRGPIVEPQPRISFHWYEGKIQGIVKSWYPDGKLENHREMANNAKNGVLTAWYRDGSLMLIEEYENNKLLKGDYFKKGEKLPISQVIQSKGTATIYDAEGHFVQKISYLNGKPEKK